MDGVLADGRKGKLWFCKRHDGHALGLRIFVPIANKDYMERLLLFNCAVSVVNGAIDLSDVRVKAKLDGTALDIECEICGAKRTWWSEQTALNLLEALYGKGTPPPAPPQMAAQFGEGRKAGK